MFFSEFYWSDILLSHYLLSLLVSLIAIIVTFVISKKYNFLHIIAQKTDPVIHDELNNYEKLGLDDSHTSVSTPVMKKSPALAAEKVIKANMTEEQQLLEYQVRQKQLAQIHELMLKQTDKFGNISLSDVEEQMKLYQ